VLARHVKPQVFAPAITVEPKPSPTDNAVELATAVGRNKSAVAGVSGELTGQMPEKVVAQAYSGLHPTLHSSELNPPEPTIAKLAGIDVAAGLARANHNQVLYFRLLIKFRDSYCQGFEANFQEALDGGDWQTAQRLAHSLKGTARTLGVELIGELAAQLEAAVKQSEPGAIPEPLAVLVTELQKVGVGLDGLGG